MSEVLRIYSEEEKEKLIKKEIRRLNQIFKNLDKNLKNITLPLVERAAFMAVTLKELEEIINVEGYTVEYPAGKDMIGIKQSDNVKTHIAMVKNYKDVVKQLCDLAPVEERSNTRLAALRNE